MEAIYAVPFVGPVLEFLGYLVGIFATTSTPAITLSLATPIALGALCGVMNERSGIVNIGIEGMMLTSAFVGFIVALWAQQTFGVTAPSPIFGVTPALLIGVLAAVISGMLVSALHAWLSISVRADQIISGTVINITAAGLTGYLNRLLKPTESAGSFAPFVPPQGLVELPLVGWLFRMFLQVGPITMSVLVLAIVLQILLFRSRWGLRTRAVGEQPGAADTVGIDVIALRYRNVIFGGVFAGLAGAWLTLDFGSSFQNNMTAGRGFIALAALIFGRWTPLGAFAGALLFGLSDAIGIAIRSNPPTGAVGDFLVGIQQAAPSIYNNLFGTLPYLLTLIILAGVVGRSIAPAAVGKPYIKEGAS